MNQLLNYKVFGDGQPILILHGLFGSLDNWVTLGRRFADTYKVVLVDQRNHGKSFHDDEFDYSKMSEDVEALVEHLGIEKPILLGHSMGGKTVMQYAAYHSEKIDKLIVADIGPKEYPVHHDAIIKALRSVDFSAVTKREEIDETLAPAISEIGVRNFLMKNLKRNPDGGLAWKMNLNVIAENIEEVGKPLEYYVPIEIPTLFLRGSNSDYIKDEDFQEISEIFPDSEFETIKDAGHWLHADNPDKFYESVIKFIS